MKMVLTLAKKQASVLRGIGLGLLISFFLVLYGIIFNPFSGPELETFDEKLVVFGRCLLILLFVLILSIARIARYRFFSSEDIDSTAVAAPSSSLLCPQSILQNTLEQTVLARIVYFLWILMTPSAWLSVLPLSAGCFLVGRILFIAGFRKGAASRAIGFALTFYPTVILFLLLSSVHYVLYAEVLLKAVSPPRQNSICW
ncbi:MAPEG family protein [Synechococcus sp. MIT S9509]|nr:MULTISPECIES: MAPEG family protein [unclassified Synechococcus]KZR87207.1 MAPEG family protein [Synechococcus sp. MIT S9504]KZR92610.1 MAPEG family protein [Synechococcus sp. MIT S9509]